MAIIRSIDDLRKVLSGKKTYFTAIIFGILAAIKWYGATVPVFIWPLLTAAGMGSMRAAITKLGDND